MNLWEGNQAGSNHQTISLLIVAFLCLCLFPSTTILEFLSMVVESKFSSRFNRDQLNSTSWPNCLEGEEKRNEFCHFVLPLDADAKGLPGSTGNSIGKSCAHT